MTTYLSSLNPLNPLNPNIGYYKDWLINSLNKNDIGDNNSVGYPLMYVDKKGSTAVYPTKHGLISYTYKSLDNDKKTTKTITKYYFYKILDKWLYKDFLPLLGFVELSDDKPRLIANVDDFNGEKLLKESQEDIEKKIEFMEKILINKDIVKHVLKKVIRKYNISWAQLEDYEPEIKKYIFKYFKEKIEDSISKKRQ